MTRTHEERAVLYEAMCDICGNREIGDGEWWRSRFLEDVVLSNAIPDPERPGKFMNLTFSRNDDWGICPPCHGLVTKVEQPGDVEVASDLFALMERLRRWHAGGNDISVRGMILTLIFLLAEVPHEPWFLSPEPPKVPGVRYSYIESNDPRD